jgi:hypothetical protein
VEEFLFEPRLFSLSAFGFPFVSRVINSHFIFTSLVM